MGYTVTINDESAEDIVRGVLLNSLDAIEQVGTIEDVPVWDALNEVLAYFSTPKELEELQFRPVSNEWIDIILEHDREKIKDADYRHTGG